jgi:hypothetical protein
LFSVENRKKNKKVGLVSLLSSAKHSRGVLVETDCDNGIVGLGRRDVCPLARSLERFSCEESIR